MKDDIRCRNKERDEHPGLELAGRDLIRFQQSPRLYRYVYVVGVKSHTGGVHQEAKIGISHDPNSRLKWIASQLRQTSGLNRLPFLFARFHMLGGDAESVERFAHRRLEGESLGGEWFSVSAMSAVEAVFQGIADCRALERRARLAKR